jgi:porphobilinogen synthase
MRSYPQTRLRRTRQADWIRRLVGETELSVNDLIWPIFVIDGKNKKEKIKSMPGVERLSIDLAVKAAKQAADLGITTLALFPNTDPKLKDENGSESTNPDNVMCRAAHAIKKSVPNIGIMIDVALDPYTSHGHDGIVVDGKIDNDLTIEALVTMALVQAEAGCDIVGPSDMMDGRVGAIRQAFENNNFQDTMIMAYSAKYASAFYGPFREAVGTKGILKGDKKTYQQNPANSDEAIQEIAMDLAEGADMVMIKPGLPYLDIIRRVKDTFQVPTFAYHVSGEYSMIKAADQLGWMDGERAMFESLLSIKRAGANGILTYYALEMAKRLAGK